MLSTIKIIDKDYINKDIELKAFFNADYIYLPYKNQTELKLPQNHFVKKDSLLVTTGDNKVFSSVSGKIIGKTNDMLINGNKVNSIIVENDFMENTKRHGIIRNITNLSKEQILDLLDHFSSYKNFFINNIDYFVISGIDEDPYEHTKSLIINNYCDKILETIDALSTIFSIKETYLVIKNNDDKNVLNLNNNIGTYPYIDLKLLPDFYPIGNKNILLQELFNKKELEKNIVYLTVEDILSIYNILKKKKPNTDKYIMISGNAIKETILVCTKLGTSLKEIVNATCEIIDKNYKIVKNGLIKGITLPNFNEIVTNDMNSIFITKELKESELKCINCGLCTSRCPVGINPKYIKEHKNADKSKCIQCGLCTYICPSKINFKECLGDKNE